MNEQYLWHPFADLSRVPGNEVTLVSGDGCWVTDDHGKRYLDATASLWYCSVGHGRAELADAAAAQMRKLAAYHVFDVFANEPALNLAERLASFAPTGRESASFFTSGGSEAIETAMKLARLYWSVLGEDRRIVVAREGAYHGMAAFGTSLAGIQPNRDGWGPLVQDVIHVEADSVGAFAEVLERNDGKIAAFIGEPVRGAAGVYPPSAGYWAAIQTLCDDHQVLLIADEVITGFGRLGTPFGSERFGIAPDLACAAKGLSSGYAPLGVVLAGARVRDALWRPGVGAVRHGYTYSGHPTACAVALANLDILEREGLYERVRELEPRLAAALAPLEDHQLVHEVRTIGLLAGIEIDPATRAGQPGIVDEVVRLARRRGLLVRGLLGRTLQISPPFTIAGDEVDQIAELLRLALDDAVARVPASLGSIGV
jgi:adenosylmethionine-8-amino-7-oxononanoate aminotransferase